MKNQYFSAYGDKTRYFSTYEISFNDKFTFIKNFFLLVPGISPFVESIASTATKVSIKVLPKDEYGMHGLVRGVKVFYRVKVGPSPANITDLELSSFMNKIFYLNHTKFYSKSYEMFVIDDLIFFTYYEIYLKYFTSIGFGKVTKLFLKQTKEDSE